MFNLVAVLFVDDLFELLVAHFVQKEAKEECLLFPALLVEDLQRTLVHGPFVLSVQSVEFLVDVLVEPRANA